jgi:RNA 3'-terminal phosphate cyclase (ATP)
MITIDGAEGFGQVLRTAVGLSALTLQPIKVTNIRTTRPRPGLMPQHMTGIEIAAEFCNAEITGLQFGSTEIEFVPKKLDIKDKRIDIGTSGSIPLLLQTLIPILIFNDRRVSLEIIGGTAGLGSPTIEYIKHITFPVLNKVGVPPPTIEAIKQGFYPRGGGIVQIVIEPVMKLRATNLIDQGDVLEIKGISIAGSLPEDIAVRQADSAKNILTNKGMKNISIETASMNTYSQGTSITLWAECQNAIVGSDNIGRRGVRAEDVGREAAQELINSIQSNTALDKYMADQIIPFLALAEGKSVIKVEEITQHCITNIYVCEQLLKCKFKVDKLNKRIEVEGIGLKK